MGAIFTGPYWAILGSPRPPDWFYGLRLWETHGCKALAAKLRMDTIRGMLPCMNSYKAWAFLQDLESLALRGKTDCEMTHLSAEYVESYDDVG